MENKHEEGFKSDFLLHADPFIRSLTEKEMDKFIDMLVLVDYIYLENLDSEDC